MFSVVVKKFEHDVLVVFHEVFQSAYRQMAVGVTEFLEDFLDAVCGLSHCRDDEHQVATVFILKYFLEIPDSISVFNRRTTELKNTINHDEIFLK